MNDVKTLTFLVNMCTLSCWLDVAHCTPLNCNVITTKKIKFILIMVFFSNTLNKPRNTTNLLRINVSTETEITFYCC